MLNNRNRSTGLSFPTILCLIVFLLLAVKAGILFHTDGSGGSGLLWGKYKGDTAFLECEGTVSSRSEEEKGSSRDSQAPEENGTEDAESVSANVRNSGEPEVSVLITDASGKNQHKNVRITGSADFTITSAAGTDTYSSGDSVKLADYFEKRNINSCSAALVSSGAVFSGEAGTENNSAATVAGIQVLSLEKGGLSPTYPGILHVQWDSKKQNFYLVNELKLESYLPGVVSSEMPDSFGLEALKTQAVCARSYALSVLETGNVQEKGEISWNLVDTTNDQVYMSGPVDALAVTACEQTQGQVLVQDNAPLKPHYYSTSWGKQADGGVFSGEEAEVLEVAAEVAQSQDQVLKMNQAFMQTYELLEQRVSGENVSYDLESPWFRWTCSIPLAELCEKAVEAITVTERGAGGYASKLMISYEDGTAEAISGAKSIRERLGAESNLYYLKDGSTRSGLSILPSAFFYLDAPETEDGVSFVKMYGGGFGHGCGMSQYGAAKMAETEHKYTEILSYYYKSAQVCEYY